MDIKIHLYTVHFFCSPKKNEPKKRVPRMTNCRFVHPQASANQCHKPSISRHSWTANAFIFDSSQLGNPAGLSSIISSPCWWNGPRFVPTFSVSVVTYIPAG